MSILRLKRGDEVRIQTTAGEEVQFFIIGKHHGGGLRVKVVYPSGWSCEHRMAEDGLVDLTQRRKPR